MSRALAAALAAALLIAAPAQATTLTGRPKRQLARYQRWVDRALVPTTHERVALRMDGCPGAFGATPQACTSSFDPSIYLYAAAGRFVLLHELGHRFDYRMPAWVRTRFAALTHDTRPWRAPGGPAERFADAYANCAITGERRAVCRLIWQAARERSSRFDFPR